MTTQPARATQQATPLAETVTSQVRHLLAYDDTGSPGGLYDRVLQEVERPLLEQVMLRCQGNQLKAAAMLGINRNTLRKKLRRHKLLPDGAA